MYRRTSIAVAAILLTAIQSMCRADTIGETARQLSAKYGDSVVNVSAVTKTEMTGLSSSMAQKAQERKVDILGTVINADGMIVLSESALNPASLIGEITNVGEKNQTIKLHGTASDIKVRLADGREFPARQIFTDSELHITFLVPELKEGEEKPKFKPIELAKSSRTDMSDQIIILTRGDKSMNYEPSVVVDRVTSVVHKPRIMYIPSVPTGSNLGVPVFSESSGQIGLITVIRKNSSTGGSDHRGMTAQAQAIVVVVPMEEVMDLAEQALKAAKEKKADQKTETGKEADPGKTEKK